LLGALRIREGEVERGIELVRSAVASLRTGRQNLLLAGAVLTLAMGLAGAGRFDEALSVPQEALADTHEGAEMSHLPELLRVQGEILFMRAQPDEAAAEVTLERALSVARQQGALSRELRGSITLARLRAKQGRGHEGRELGASVYARFTEGFGTPDLRNASLETSV
jgi:predicted ATPase